MSHHKHHTFDHKKFPDVPQKTIDWFIEFGDILLKNGFFQNHGQLSMSGYMSHKIYRHAELHLGRFHVGYKQHIADVLSEPEFARPPQGTSYDVFRYDGLEIKVFDDDYRPQMQKVLKQAEDDFNINGMLL
jgi:hypothetical protein